MKIQLLDSIIFNRIAAGEVVERPASIVKELVENSIDAGASVISIEIEDGGKKKITVSDNGHGIEKDDLEKAFLPHATSKIKCIKDLDRIQTLGFRGEALASIASVCHIYASSKTADAEVGSSIRIDGGLFSEIKDVMRNQGTTIEASDLFYNAPVREKFLKNGKREGAEITHLVEKFMLAHPEISFLYVSDGKQVYNTISTELSDIIYTIYGKEIYEKLIKVEAETDGISLSGFVVSPKYSKVNRTFQTLFVNGRYVENYLVSSAVQGAFEPFLMKGRFPIYVLGLKIDPEIVDVNIHPTKKEVKFQNPNAVFAFVLSAVKNALQGQNMIASYENSVIDENHFSQIELRDENNQQGFSHIPVADLEPLPKKEGKSFGEVLSNATSKSESQTKEVVIEKEPKKPAFPDFLNISLDDDLTINKKGGPIFFDQTQTRHAGDFAKIGKEASQDKFLEAQIDEEMKIVGTIFKTYIIVELDDKVYFIDQHAAHERTLFDKLCSQAENQQVLKQPLLIDYEVKATHKEMERLENALKSLSLLGFEIEQNDCVFKVKAVPLVLSSISLGKFFEDVLADESIWVKSTSEVLKNRLAQYACKHAIKAGDVVNKETIAYILEQMRKGVLLCPHGRPIVVEMTKRDFEKMFKRIV